MLRGPVSSRLYNLYSWEVQRRESLFCLQQGKLRSEGTDLPKISIRVRSLQLLGFPGLFQENHRMWVLVMETQDAFETAT